jgi:hypothetical protein
MREALPESGVMIDLLLKYFASYASLALEKQA